VAAVVGLFICDLSDVLINEYLFIFIPICIKIQYALNIYVTVSAGATEPEIDVASTNEPMMSADERENHDAGVEVQVVLTPASNRADSVVSVAACGPKSRHFNAQHPRSCCPVKRDASNS